MPEMQVPVGAERLTGSWLLYSTRRTPCNAFSRFQTRFCFDRAMPAEITRSHTPFSPFGCSQLLHFPVRSASEALFHFFLFRCSSTHFHLFKAGVIRAFHEFGSRTLSSNRTPLILIRCRKLPLLVGPYELRVSSRSQLYAR